MYVLRTYLDRKFGLSLSLSEITSLFDLSLDLDRTLAQRKAQRTAKSKVKVAECQTILFPCSVESSKTYAYKMQLLVILNTSD